MTEQERKKRLAELQRLSKMDNVWVRLTKLPEFGNLPGIFSTLPEWAMNGYYPEALGMVPAPSLTKETPVPHLQDIALDVGRGSDVNFVRLSPGELVSEPEKLVSGEFGDPHPTEWVNGLFKEGRGLLVISEDGPGRHKTMGTWIQTWFVGVVPLANYYDKNGVSPIRPRS